MGKVAVDILK